MQNLSNKASILLWSIFLSLFIISIFISISTKTGKIIEENSKIKTLILKNQNKENKLRNNNISGNIKVSNTEILYKDNSKFFNFLLKKDEKFDIQLNKDTDLTFKPIGGAIFEIYIGGNKFLLTKEKKSISVKNGENIKIKNLGGMSKIEISSMKDISFPYNKYKIIENIGGKKIEKEIGTIKNP